MLNLFHRFLAYLANHTWFNDIKLAVKQLNIIPSLPIVVDYYYNHLLTRILRVIGGLATLAVLLQKHLLFPYPIDIMIVIIAFLQFTQMFIIYITKFLYGIYYISKNPECTKVRSYPPKKTRNYK